MIRCAGVFPGVKLATTMKRQFTGAERLAASPVKACALLLCPLLATASISIAAAEGIRQWERDVALTTASGDQGLMRPIVISDGSDGAFFIWHDRLRGRISVQRLASDGSKLWPAAKQVATTLTDKMFPAAVASGQGGVIVAWAEGRSGGCIVEGQAECDIYAQKFDGNGQRLWRNVGRPVVRAPKNQGVASIALASDEQGGVYAAWVDARPSCCKIYAQHLGADGRPLWAENGIRISPEPFIVFGPIDEPLAIGDGEGGVLIAWIESQVNPVTERSPLKVQRLDADGNALWSDGGLPVGTPSSVYFSMAPDSDGGALIGYTMDGVNGFFDAAVQKVALDGTTPWGPEGVRAAVAAYYQIATEVVADDRGGAFVAWLDRTTARFHQNDADIRAQHVLSSGQLAWPNTGRIISDLPGNQDNPRVVRDGNGGAFVFWRDCRDYLERDPCFFSANIYGQHIRRNGTLAWAGQGAPVAKAAGSQGVPQGTPIQASSIAAASGALGGAFLAWPDGRIAGCANAVFTTECDVRAQRVADDRTPVVADLELGLSTAYDNATAVITFRFTVRNLGPDAVQGIKLHATDLQNLVVQGTPANGTMVGNTLYVALGNLAVGGARTVSFPTKRVNPGKVCVTGRLYSETLDTTGTNDRRQVCVTERDY